MIFLLIVVFVLGFFVCWNLIPNQTISNITGIIFAVLSIFTVFAVVANFNSHLGMKKATVQTTTKVASVNPQMKMLLYQPVGTNGKEQAVIYKKNDQQKKPTVSKPALDTKNIVEKNSNKTELVTKSEYWVYKNDFYKTMFGVAQKHELIKRTRTFKVDGDYLVMTTAQAKEFQSRIKKLAKEQQSNPATAEAAKAQGEQFVQGKMMESLQKNPDLSDKEKTVMTKKYTEEFQKEMKAKAMQQLTKQVISEMKIQ